MKPPAMKPPARSRILAPVAIAPARIGSTRAKRRLAALLLAWLPGLALAQIAAPASPTATRSTSTVTPAPIYVPPAAPSPSAASAAAPVQAPLPAPSQPRQPIPSSGPAQVQQAPVQALPDKVYDRNGRILPGVKMVGPNRVLDTNTGRYYDSQSQGGLQQIKP